MTLADSLRFVRGAVAKKDFVPALTHFRIKDGRITGYNGRIALSAPIDLDLDIMPKADKFIKAINACKDTVQMNMTAAGRLSIKSGSFRAYIECLPIEEADAYPHFEPSGNGTTVDVPSHFAQALEKLSPFIGDDASRPWSNGILFRGGSAYATNNVALAEYWMGEPLPYILNVPGKSIQELMRLRTVPQSVAFDEHSVTFIFEGERWMRSQLKDLSWPDLNRVLAADHAAELVPNTLGEALETLKPFCDELGRVHFHDGYVCTMPDGVEDGSMVAVDGLHGLGIYNVKILQSVLDVATHVDFKNYPKPCLWFGDRIRGAIIGMRPDAR